MVQLERISGWHDIFCRLLAEGKPFATACAFAQIPATRVYNEMGNDAKFKARVERAKAEGRGEGEGFSGGAVTGVRNAAMDRK